MGRRARGSEDASPAAAPLTHPVRLSALAALDIQQAREWHDAKEPGLGDQFLQRVNETMTRIGQNPTPVPDDHRRRSKGQPRQFKYGIWYRVKADGSVVVACLHHRQQQRLLRRGLWGGAFPVERTSRVSVVWAKANQVVPTKNSILRINGAMAGF